MRADSASYVHQGWGSPYVHQAEVASRVIGRQENACWTLVSRQVAALSLLKIVKQSTKLRLQCGGRCNLLGRRKKIFVCLPASHNRQQSLWNLESEWYLM